MPASAPQNLPPAGVLLGITICIAIAAHARPAPRTAERGLTASDWLASANDRTESPPAHAPFRPRRRDFDSHAGRGSVAQGRARVEPAARGTLPPELRAAYIASRQREAASATEFAFRQNGSIVEAANPSQHFTAALDGRGIDIEFDGHRGRLEATSIACDGRVVPLDAGELRIAANRAEISRGFGHAELQEWFANGPLGVEQGFVVNGGCSGTLILELVTPGLRAHEAGDEVRLVPANGGRALRYSDLHATDDAGRVLNSSLKVSGDTVIAQVDVAGAKWPVVIDPLLWFEVQSVGPVVEGDGEPDDHFGYQVAIDGNTAVIGAPRDVPTDGAAYVYIWDGSTWVQQAKLTAPVARGGEFGYSVSIEGDSIVVGAPSQNAGAVKFAGAAHVYSRIGATWSLQTTLTAADAATDDRFGSAVAISLGTVVVGAPMNPSILTRSGRAYVYVGSGATWAAEAELQPTNARILDEFGSAVALQGDTLVVGAPASSHGTASSTGAAYVFVRSTGAWGQDAELLAGDGLAGDRFGEDVAMDGGTVAVGASQDDNGAGRGRGSAYVFVSTGTSWTAEQKLISVDGDQFGRSVAITGDTVVVGAPYATVGSASYPGAAYTFVRIGSSWTLQQKLIAPDGANLDALGWDVATTTDLALIGAFGDTIDGNTAQGSAYVFGRTGTNWAFGTKIFRSPGAHGDQLGTSVALDGDTAVIGAPLDDVAGHLDQGSAYVYVNAGGAWTLQGRLHPSDGSAQTWFGQCVSISGDLIVVGAPHAGTGYAYVYARNGATWSEEAKLAASDAQGGDEFGGSVSISGGTVVVGAPVDGVGTYWRVGTAYVFVRSGTTWSEQAHIRASDAFIENRFATSVAVDGDTLVVGAPFRSFGGSSGTPASVGATYVFVRSGSVWSQQAMLTASDAAQSDHFGMSVAVRGDMMLVGAPGVDIGGAIDRGAAYVFERTAGAWSEKTRLFVSNGAALDEFGAHLAMTATSLVLGVPTREVVYVFTGDTSSGFTSQTLSPSDAWGYGRFGDAVAASDTAIVVGSTSKTGPQPFGEAGEGRAYFFEGRLGCDAGTYSADGTTATTCIPCASGTWSSFGATRCSPWTVCGQGTYLTADGTSSTDRICTRCTGGASYSCAYNAYQSGVACTGTGSVDTQTCALLTICSVWQYETMPPTTSSDRMCAYLTNCTSTQYQSVPPTATTDRTCADLTICGSAEYQSTAPTATSDRVCSPCRVCASGTHVMSACTASRDTVCAADIPDAGNLDVGMMDSSIGTSDASTDGALRADAGSMPSVGQAGCGCRVTAGSKAEPGAGAGKYGAGVLAMVLGHRIRRRSRRQCTDTLANSTSPGRTPELPPRTAKVPRP